MPLTQDEVKNSIYQLIAEQLGIELSEIKDSSNLVTDLDADSLDVIELVIGIEEAFEIEVSDSDAEKLATVGQVVEYVQKRVG